jgi:hypothetical protein
MRAHRDVVEGRKGESSRETHLRAARALSGRGSGEVRRVRSHAVAVPSHPAGDLGAGGCGSAAAAHGSQASRRDPGDVAVPMIGGGEALTPLMAPSITSRPGVVAVLTTGGGEALRTRRIHARAHAGGRGHGGVGTAVEKGVGTVRGMGEGACAASTGIGGEGWGAERGRDDR